MRGNPRLRSLALILAAAVTACAGDGPGPSPPVEPAPLTESAAEAGSLQELLARLDVLIAGHGEHDAPPGRTAEARALRTEALALMAAGDGALARDLLNAAIALFVKGTE